jgi:hypothetical protein
MRLKAVYSLLLLLGSARWSAAQSSAPSFVERRSALQQSGAAAMAAEVEGEQSNACQMPQNTADTSHCLRSASVLTELNYKAYVASIGGLLALQPPDSTPPEINDAREVRANFRKAELLWLRYRAAQCDAVEMMSCEQDLTRHHLHELAALYLRLFQ